MAFPTIESVTATVFDSATTAHAVNMPATVNAGDLLVVLFRLSDDGVSITTPANWTAKSTDITGALYMKIATGSEGGGTVDFVSSVAGGGSAQTYRVSGWYGDITTTGIAWAAATGTSLTPDPPNLSPGWGTLDIMWLAVMFNNTSRAVTGSPANYTNSTETTDTYDDDTIVSARRALAASSENPGTFQFAAGTDRPWRAITIAIRPAAAGETFNFTGSQTVSFDGTAELVQSATFSDSQTVSFDGTAALVQSATFTDSQTVSFDGTAALKQTANLTGAETVSFDGSIGTVQIEHHFEGAEEVSFDGTADTVVGHYLMDGAQTVSFDGSAALKQTAALTGGEMVSFDGTAALDIAAIAFAGQGVLSFDGSIATLNLILEMEAAQSVLFDGEAALGQQALFEGGATLSFDGVAALTGFQWDPVETPASTTWSDVD